MIFHFLGKVSTHCYGECPFIGYNNVIAIDVLFIQRWANERFGNSNLPSGVNTFGRAKNTYLANRCITQENGHVS